LAPRQVAWQVLQAVAAGAYADGALERELQRQPLTGQDRALATELAYGAIRQRRLLDAWLDQLGKVPAERQPPKLRWLLHLGLYQLLASDRVPASAAVSTSVELAKRGGLARLAPVVNGLLRSFLRQQEAGGGLVLSADPALALAQRQSLPDWLAQALLTWLQAPQAEAFAVACNQPPNLDLRCNPLRGSRDQLLADLRAAGVAAEPLAGLPQGLVLLGRSGDLRQLPGYTEGRWCVQDRSAQRIAPLLDPQPGERILDACAAPGGKSTHLAELMGDRGEVVALDRSAARLQRVGRNLERLGLTCIQTRVGDGTHLAGRPEPTPSQAGDEPGASPPGPGAGDDDWWQGGFDRILVDAPCSGLGTLARHADARWRVGPAAIDDLVLLQRQLLEGLAPLLRPGGRLVYATCTVHPRENGELIAAFLAAHPHWRLLESWQLWPGQGPAGEAAGPQGQAPGAGGDPTGGDGFFAAALQAPG
jgi:16S rRNA (cytosine967-C5)-methyltransferase